MRILKSLTIISISISFIITSLSPLKSSAKNNNTPAHWSLSGTLLAGQFAQSIRDIPNAATYLSSALKRAPNNKDILRRAFILNIMEGRIQKARALAARTLESTPKAQIANTVLLSVAAKEGRWGDLLARAKTLDPKGLLAFFLPPAKGWAEFASGKKSAALIALEPLKENETTMAMFALHAGLMLEHEGKLSEAESHLIKVFDGAGSGSYKIAKLLGIIYERQGRKDKALEIYNAFLAVRPSSNMLQKNIERIKTQKKPPVISTLPSNGIAEALFEIASMLYSQASMDTALLLGQLALYIKPNFPSALILVSDIMINEKRYASANELLKKINQSSVFYKTAQLRVAGNLDDMGQFDNAIKKLEVLANKNPTDYLSIFAIGDIFRRHKRWTDAINAYDRAFFVLGTPKKHHWRYLYTRAISLERAKIWPRAEIDFLKALELKPSQPDVLNYLGYSWIEKGKHLERALEMVKTAVKLRPNSGYIIDSLGWAYYQLKRYNRAIPELERAVELRSEDPIINDHLGDAYWKVGRKLEAKFQWNHALALNPEPDLKKTLVQKLNHGLSDEPKTVEVEEIGKQAN